MDSSRKGKNEQEQREREGEEERKHNNLQVRQLHYVGFMGFAVEKVAGRNRECHEMVVYRFLKALEGRVRD